MMCICCKRQVIAIGNCCTNCYNKMVLPKYRVKETKKK